jgi:hypothetical protein
LLERELQRGKEIGSMSAVELLHIKDVRVVKTHLDGLGDPEGEDQVAEVQSSEEEEDPTLVKGDDEERSSLGDGKVVQPAMRHDRSRISHLRTASKTERRDLPLRSVGESDTISPRPGVEQLGDVDPDETSPREAVRDDEEVDEDGHPDGSSRSLGSVLVRGVGVEDGTDHHQEGSHTQGTEGRESDHGQPGRYGEDGRREIAWTHP